MHYLGIDLGGTNIAAGILDENMKMIRKGSTPTGRDRHYSEIIRDMALLALKLLDETGLSEKGIPYIGIGSPGIADRENGILLFNGNLRFKHVPIRQEMQKSISLPVYLENDANCAALAEGLVGAARDVEDSITVTLGTGIGGGIILGNKIFTGFNGMAGEIGHIVIGQGGEKCTCGRDGCWEAYASATALIRQTRRAAQADPGSAIHRLVQGNLDNISAKTAFDAMREGDPTGMKVVKQYIRYLAEGVADMINIFQPSKIVIGGGISKEGETLLRPLREAVRELSFFGSGNVPQTRIVCAETGNDAGIIGAAVLGMQKQPGKPADIAQ
jgi:glucokinase